MKVLIASDLHCGSKYGLTPPGWQMQKYEDLQGPLWDWWYTKVQEKGPYDCAVMNGDAIEGPGKKGTLGLITSDPEEQAEMSIVSMGCVPTDKWVITRGTPFHVTTFAEEENRIAKEYNTELVTTARLEADWVKLNIRHIGHRSDTVYAQGTQTAKPAGKDMYRSAVYGYEAAEIYIRSHVHYYTVFGARKNGGVFYSFTTPCVKYPLDNFGSKLDPTYYDMGFMILNLSDGKIQGFETVFYDYNRGEEWKYETIPPRLKSTRKK